MSVDITTDPTHIKRIIREYYELYTNKFEIFDEMNQFLERDKPPKFTQKEIENLNTLKY